MVQKSGDHQFCMASIYPSFTWFHSCQVVQDFFQQYFFSIGTLVNVNFDTRSILSPFYQDYGYSRNLLASILLKSIHFCSCLTCSVTHRWIWMFKMLWVRHDKTLPEIPSLHLSELAISNEPISKNRLRRNPTRIILIQITYFFWCIETHRVQEGIAMERCQKVLQGPQHLSWLEATYMHPLAQQIT